jgi:putative DNA primase/helicase
VHKYLEDKGIQAHGLRLHGKDLVVPMHDIDGSLHGLQFIAPDGSKRFSKASRKRGCFYLIGKLAKATKAICIAEGFATGASVFESTGLPTAVAFDCGNLRHVAEAIRAKHPKAKIILCADDDAHTDGNPGLTKATEAARAVDGFVAVPDFGDKRPDGATDLNDQHKLSGPKTVKACVAKAKKPAPPKSLLDDTPAATPGDVQASTVPIRPGDDGRAKRLARLLGDRVLYCREAQQYLLYTAGRYVPDIAGDRLLTETEAVPRELLGHAATSADADERKSLRDEAKIADSCRGKKAMIELLCAQSGVSVDASALDADPLLLNFKNGTLHLGTREFRPHRPIDRLTKVLDYDYRPGTACPRFERFLAQVWPERLVQLLMQRFAGYCLSGLTTEQKFVFLFGTGSNGKGVFARILKALLGAYCVQSPISMLLESRDNRSAAAPELVDLRGARLSICSEPPPGAYINASVICAATGEDAIAARKLYQHIQSWQPTHKFLVLGNHKLRTRGVSEAIRRRLCLVDCGQHFTGASCDPHLYDKLMKELPGIAVWAIEGFQQWQKTGLDVPESVRAAGEEFARENDPLADFFERACDLDDKALCTRRELFQHYREFCAANNVAYPLSQPNFTAQVAEHGIRDGGKRRIKGAMERMWNGIQPLKLGASKSASETSGFSVIPGGKKCKF